MALSCLAVHVPSRHFLPSSHSLKWPSPLSRVLPPPSTITLSCFLLMSKMRRKCKSSGLHLERCWDPSESQIRARLSSTSLVHFWFSKPFINSTEMREWGTHLTLHPHPPAADSWSILTLFLCVVYKIQASQVIDGLCYYPSTPASPPEDIFIHMPRH